ncbi:hypothetical protein JQ629_13795 [Bradyrhizobium sp. AUGA SZCCT0222]|uniref:hypothetical protein n=1 Tax=Bradyrhizobium sp. AUGA SZCCT0222 TaxID=2807668 RepID=UPI001BA8FA73|nr:hypothetical protein [Bradyrhizobium sp. AUGA SZCCT0222]MBR1268588.1 hypothetical protein [Bradyrhizobium sp. AUGA SZCCT0222]
MSWEERHPTRGIDGALRHSDGSPDIAAYVRIARREREAAIISAVQDAAGNVRAMSSAIWRVLGRPGRIRSNAPLRS